MTDEGGSSLKPLLLIGVAVAAVLGVAAIAFAANGGGSSDNHTAQVASPTPTSTVEHETPVPAQGTSAPSATPVPFEPDAGMGPAIAPAPAEPDGGIGDTPVPVEPNGGNGSSDTPIVSPAVPINPDGSIASPPLPVEPNGGIGDTPVNSDTPIPTEPIIPVTPVAPQPSLPPGRYAEAAPIDQLDLMVAESYPPQYFVHIMAGLPSGCAEQYTHSVSRNGNAIEIEVLNSFPTGNPVCTAIYGTYELNIGLGSDFTPGETYTISVNNGAAETEFTAQ
jgi:hypothetical protein